MIPKKNILLIWPENDEGFYDFSPIGLITGRKSLFFPLPLIYVAAAIGNEWNYTLVDECIEPLSDTMVRNADFYLLSVNLLQRTSAERLLERLLPCKKPIIIGGTIISTLGHIFNHPGVSKVYGEIEAEETSETGTTIADLLSRDLKHGTLRKEYHAKGYPDITKNKPPRYDLIKSDGYLTFSMQTSRGVPDRGDFFRQAAVYCHHRRKTNIQITEELNNLLNLNHNINIIITDDNFTGNLNTPRSKQELFELLHTIRQWQEQHDYPFDFFSQCPIDLANHDDVMELMSKIGLNVVFIDIDTVDESTPASVKNTSEKLRSLQRFGMGIFAGVSIGLDNESGESITRRLEFIKKAAIPFVAPALLMAFEGTNLYEKLRMENRISRDPDALTKKYRTNIIPLIPTREMYGHFKLFIKQLYDPKNYFLRCSECTKIWNDAYVIPGKKGSMPTHFRILRIIRSFFFQGVLSGYRFEYLKYMVRSAVRFRSNPNKLALSLYLGYIFHFLYNSTKRTLHFIDNLPQDLTEEWEARFPKDSSK